MLWLSPEGGSVSLPTTRVASTEPFRRHGRPDPRVAQTKQLVLEAAFAVIAESGFAGATVERIAERSGVARSSIYRHWPSPRSEERRVGKECRSWWVA